MGKHDPSRAIATMFVVAVFLLLTGCGDLSRSPMAPDQTAAISDEQPTALVRAAKPADKSAKDETTTVTTEETQKKSKPSKDGTSEVTSKTGPSRYDLTDEYEDEYYGEEGDW